MAFVQRITAWSYSRYQKYKQCPFAAKCAFIDRIKEPENEAMSRGNIVHKMAENHTKGIIKTLPTELAKFKKQFTELRKEKAEAESQWCFNSLWKKVDWFARDAWCRIKVDAHRLIAKTQTLVIVDHKTGRIHDEHSEQRSLYALGGLLLYPEAKFVRAEHWYLDSGDQRVDEFPAFALPDLQREWVEKTKPMLSDKRFAPSPGNHCRWCAFSASKGGPCRY